MLVRSLLVLLLPSLAVAAPQTVATIASPGTVLSVALQLDDGRAVRVRARGTRGDQRRRAHAATRGGRGAGDPVCGQDEGGSGLNARNERKGNA